MPIGHESRSGTAGSRPPAWLLPTPPATLLEGSELARDSITDRCAAKLDVLVRETNLNG